MNKLSNVDKKYFKEFKKKYPGWNIERLEDNSIKFVPPESKQNVKNDRRIYIDRD